MKKISLIAVMLMLMAGNLLAQQPHHINSFFDKNGAVRLETTELKGDTVITLFHRSEDILWHRTVYSVIDMRFKQNFQMYFPITLDNPRYRSLFGVMMEAIVDGLPVYAKPMQPDLNPHLDDPNRMQEPRNRIPGFLELSSEDGEAAFDLGALDMSDMMEDDGMMMEGEGGIDADLLADLSAASSVLKYDSASNTMVITEYYPQYVKNQLKFLIQEHIFFDKHYSRLYRCITAIAPLYAPNAQEGADTYDALYQQICFWVPFAALRPYMAHQYMIASKNNSKRLTYDEFFAQRLYTSYIVGEDNMYDRVIPQYVKTEESMKAEQKRIETELLEFEQNLWEY